MSIISILVIFIISWWLIFFMALPISVEAETDFIPGQDQGAPKVTHLKIKALITTAIAFVLTAIAYGIDQMEILSLRDF